MSDPVRGVVLAHAQLAEALVRAVEQISGVTDALHPISNEGLRPEDLRTRLEAATGAEAAIIFVDLSSGSCAFAGRVVARGSDNIAVLTGVNLPMLLDFVFNRELSLTELTERLLHKGRAEMSAHRGSGRVGSQRP